MLCYHGWHSSGTLRISGFARFRDPALRIRRILRILPSPRWLKNVTEFIFFSENGTENVNFGRAPRAHFIYFLSQFLGRGSHALWYILWGGGGGGVIATSIWVLEAWGTAFRSCQGARLDVVSALTLCNPWNYSSIFLHRFFRHYSEIPTALPAYDFFFGGGRYLRHSRCVIKYSSALLSSHPTICQLCVSSIRLSVCPSVCLSCRFSVWLYALMTWLSSRLTNRRSFCRPLFRSLFCPSFCLSLFCLFVCMSVRSPVNPFFYLSIRLSVPLSLYIRTSFFLLIFVICHLFRSHFRPSVCSPFSCSSVCLSFIIF